jgi:hypothetical protein
MKLSRGLQMETRKVHWEKIYSEKSPLEVSWYQAESELSLRLIRNSGVAKKEPLIDVGGGASVLVDRLLAEQYRPTSLQQDKNNDFLIFVC